MKEWFAAYDFLLSPVSGPAPRNADLRPGQRGASAPGFMLAFNTAYNPAAAVPFAFHPNGLPLAIQVVGRLGDDVGVLRLAAAIEAQQPWAHRWPPLATAPPGRAARAEGAMETPNDRAWGRLTRRAFVRGRGDSGHSAAGLGLLAGCAASPGRRRHRKLRGSVF